MTDIKKQLNIYVLEVNVIYKANGSDRLNTEIRIFFASIQLSVTYLTGIMNE